jgi:uncharacterized cupin superfamily protein
MKKFLKGRVAHFCSPKGKFGQTYRDFSVKGAPFDLGWCSIKSGQAHCPYHYHTAQWEMYAILRGTGYVRTPKGRSKIRAGDIFMCPPREPHQLINTGKRDLEYYVIADNPVGDSCYYPDSDKWLVDHRVIKGQRVPYLTGEE